MMTTIPNKYGGSTLAGMAAKKFSSKPRSTWLHARLSRERRIFWLLLVAWMINAFDFALTHIAHEQSLLVEMNPVAAIVLPYGPVALAVYKLVLLTIGTTILWYYRRHRVTETATWVYAVLCLALSLWWHHVYEESFPLWAYLHSSGHGAA